MRVKAVLSYDGGCFQGFQRQTSTDRTVTSAIEAALRRLHISSSVTGSGRTDAGVHATGQVIHFDLPDYWSNTHKLRQALNRHLHHIRIKCITAAEDDFHARFSAKRRIYRYVFKTTPPSLFESNYIAHYSLGDLDLLENSLALLQGEHDFGYFHKTGSNTHHAVRNIYNAHCRRLGNYHLLYFEADGFLRAQVRMMVEAVMQCANGQLSLDMLKEQIEGKARHTTALASPAGLYLARIIY
jgi:tRNA pseudouridine38-40 synthase